MKKRRDTFKWYKIIKSYRGGSNVFQIRVPNVPMTGSDWDELLEYVAENTDGGHRASYDGYRIERRLMRKKSKDLNHFSYPNHLLPQFARYGKTVIIERKMI